MTIITDSFQIIITLLHRVGMYEGKKSIFKLVWTYFLYLSSIVLIILTVVNMLVEEDHDDLELNQMVLLVAEGAAGALKLLPFLTNSKRIKKCVDYFGDKQYEAKNDEERKILEDCVRVCQRNIKIYFAVMIFGLVCWNTLPFFESQDRRLSANLWLPFGLEDLDGVVFYPLYIYVAAVVFYMGLISEMVEPLIGGLTYHATCQLKLLKYNLQNLAMFTDKPTVQFDDVKDVLKRCIIHHNNILDFIKEFEDTFSFSVFCQISGSLFGLCACLIGMMMVSPTSVYGIIYATCYSILTFQMLFYCHYGTLLFQENEDLISSVYVGNWYLYDARVRKTLIIIMERSKKSINLTAGKVINLTYQTYTSVLKSSYSLIAVMNNYE